MNRLPKYFFAGALIIGVVTSPTIAFDIGFTSSPAVGDGALEDGALEGGALEGGALEEKVDAHYTKNTAPLSELKMLAAKLRESEVRNDIEVADQEVGDADEEETDSDRLFIDDKKIEKLDETFYRFVMSRFIKGMASKY